MYHGLRFVIVCMMCRGRGASASVSAGGAAAVAACGRGRSGGRVVAGAGSAARAARTLPPLAYALPRRLSTRPPPAGAQRGLHQREGRFHYHQHCCVLFLICAQRYVWLFFYSLRLKRIDNYRILSL